MHCTLDRTYPLVRILTITVVITIRNKASPVLCLLFIGMTVPIENRLLRYCLCQASNVIDHIIWEAFLVLKIMLVSNSKHFVLGDYKRWVCIEYSLFISGFTAKCGQWTNWEDVQRSKHCTPEDSRFSNYLIQNLWEQDTFFPGIFMMNKTGSRQSTRAVSSTFAEIHSTHLGALMHYLG